MNEKYPHALNEGVVLAGQYIIKNVLGQGGFGITYKAEDHKTGKFVAIKEFFPDTLSYREASNVIPYTGERTEHFMYGKETFLQEAKTLAEFLGNENIVRIHSYFEENNTAYFVMDFIEGISFDDYIKNKGGKISVDDARDILIPVMDALGAVHSKGIVHRDVTPDNIYITNDSKVLLLDFGAARYSLGDKSRSLDVILKHGFAPKEQYTRNGRQGPFTDIYSLGATFYFAITGKRPPDSVDRMDEDDLVPPHNLGVAIMEYQEDALLKALSVLPADRFQSMSQFKSALFNEQVFSESAVVQDKNLSAYSSGNNISGTVALTGTQQNHETQANVIGAGSSSVLKKITGNKKAAAGVAAVVIAALAGGGILLSHGGNDNKAYVEPSYEAGESQPADITAAVTAPPVTFMQKDETEAPETVTTTVPVTTAKPETAAPVTTKKPETTEKPVITEANKKVQIIGNSSVNLKNGGIFAADGNLKSFVDDNLKSLFVDKIMIYENQDESFGYLSIEKNCVYYLYSGTAYCYSILDDSDIPVSELSQFQDSLEALYVSEQYYFVYSAGMVQRVSRSTGLVEQTLRVKSKSDFLFANGYMYFIDNNKDEDCIRCVLAGDFSNHSENMVTMPLLGNDSDSSPVYNNKRIYFLQNWLDSAYIYIYGEEVFNSDSFEKKFIDISNYIDSASGGYATELCVYGSHIFFTETNGEWSRIHHITVDSVMNIVSEEVLNDGENARYPNIYIADDSFNLYFMGYDKESQKVVCRYSQFTR